jgi:hypothetical protein
LWVKRFNGPHNQQKWPTISIVDPSEHICVSSLMRCPSNIPFGWTLWVGSTSRTITKHGQNTFQGAKNDIKCQKKLQNFVDIFMFGEWIIIIIVGNCDKRFIWM